MKSLKKKTGLILEFFLEVLLVVIFVATVAYSLNPADWGWLGRLFIGIGIGFSCAKMLKKWPIRR